MEHLREQPDGESADKAVHEARKDLKKLRSVLRLVRDEVGEEAYQRENTRFRDAGRMLSGARDAEVKLATLNSLQQRFEEELGGAELDALVGRLESERNLLAGDALTAAAESTASEIEAGMEALEDWKLKTNGWGLVAEGLVRSYRRGRNRFEEVRDDPSAENVHELRKRVKDHWYQLRIVRNAWKPVLAETGDQAHALADHLGDHHDLAVLGEDLRDPAVPLTDTDREELREAIAARQQKLIKRALALGDHLYAEPPKCFERRVHGYWNAWR